MTLFKSSENRNFFITSIDKKWDVMFVKTSSLEKMNTTIVVMYIVVDVLNIASISNFYLIYSNNFSVGRRPTMLTCCIGTLIFGIAVAFSPWFPMFVVFRFMVAAFSHGSFLIACVYGEQLLKLLFKYKSIVHPL